MLLYPCDEIGAFELPCCNLEDHVFLIIQRCHDLPAIEDEKEFHCRVPNPLITVNKGMIANEGKSHRGCFISE